MLAFRLRIAAGNPANRPAPQPSYPQYIDYGYFGGGYAPAYSTVDRIDYANDTSTAVARGPLSAARERLAATGNSSYGYFGGGYASGAVSHVDRIDYANDTATASLRGPLSQARDVLAATGTSSYGYFGGGFAPGAGPVSRVDRLDYSNDTANASLRGPLSGARYAPAATGTSSYGYFGGGYAGLFPGGSPVSTVDRIDYANDTSTAVARGPLSAARELLAATGNSSYGYFGGGWTPGAVSRVDRIDYSNDTVTAVQRGPLSQARSNLAATGSSSHGYFAGGSIIGTVPSPFGPLPGPEDSSLVERIDYANDTATASLRGPLSQARVTLGGAQNCPL